MVWDITNNVVITLETLSSAPEEGRGRVMFKAIDTCFMGLMEEVNKIDALPKYFTITIAANFDGDKP